ncbi:hypothetical protein [Variovorax rhizosphaerae]|uniref:Uncharacterized protein n=1 Tax=Variovorax rhizosphaerae TaxID=1836200 RepID=A0ABU8WXL7_9BURK
MLAVALKEPALLKSAFVYEPGEATHVTDPLVLKVLGDDAAAAFAPVVQGLQSGDNAAAAGQLIDAVGGGKVYFESQPASVRSVQLDWRSAKVTTT